MKHSYTLFFSFVLLLAFNISLQAQDSYTVTASNFQFEPSSLEINEGDTVHWINMGGSHNVNGTQETFPNNPESFLSGSVSTGWSYTYVFNTPGSYNYQCDAHAATMTGTIQVSPSSNIGDLPEKEEGIISIYPNPTTEFVTFDFSNYKEDRTFITITVFNTAGALVAEQDLNEAEKIRLVTSDYKSGFYTYQIQQAGKITRTGQFIAK